MALFETPEHFHHDHTAADRQRADVVVVGAGIVGLTTARRLALLGVRDVVVLEAGVPGRQSTCRSSGGIRRQFGNRFEIEMSLVGMRFYRSIFADEAFEGTFSEIGYAFVAGSQHAPELEAAWRLQQDMGLAVDWLARSQLAEQFPYMESSDLVGGTFCKEDGLVDPWAVMRWLLVSCQRLGVTVCSDSPVDGIERSAAGVRAVQSGRHRIETDTVVNATGAWAGRVAELAGVPIPISPSPRFQMVTEPQRQLPVVPLF